MKHKDKVKMARKMLTREERKTKHRKTPIFLSENWVKRSVTKAYKQYKQRIKKV